MTAAYVTCCIFDTLHGPHNAPSRGCFQAQTLVWDILFITAGTCA